MTRRVLIVVTHLLGIGHLTRATLLADGLQASGMDVMLVSGGSPVPGPAQAQWRFVQLPPVHIVGTDFSNLLDEHGVPASDSLLNERRTMLRLAIEKFQPDILITEHFPFGRRQLATEFLAAIEAARALARPARVVASVRDVLVAPRRQDRIEQANARINTLFDLVLVHGDQAVLPLGRSWPGTAAIAGKLHYTGYITPSLPPPAAKGPDSGEIVVSGGGSGAAIPLFACAVSAAQRCRNSHTWRILVGHGVDPSAFDQLRNQAAGGQHAHRIIVERARSDFPALLAGCAASVSMAGYNTMLDLVRAGRPAVVVPFDQGQETEQALRAESWAEAGLVQVLEASQLAPEFMLEAIFRATTNQQIRRPTLDLKGIGNSINALSKIVLKS